MKFVIDRQLPATLARWFEDRGFEAVHVRDLGMREASDPAIWHYAVQHGSCVVTKEEDFAIWRAQTAGPQILCLRIGNATNRVLRAHLDAVWADVVRCLHDGEPIVEA